MIDPVGVPPARAFLARVVRLDPGAVVRLRPAGPGTVALWSRLPFEVLVSIGVTGTVDGDHTVAAMDLLATLTKSAPWPSGRDTDWRWPLPPLPGQQVESVPAIDILRISAAAASTVRVAATQGVAGRPVGSRAVRDALLDHVPILVTTGDGRRVEVGQRLVQALVRMRFVQAPTADGAAVEVRTAGPWVGLVTRTASAWYRPPLLLRR